MYAMNGIDFYPDKGERDRWISEILEDARKNADAAEFLPDNGFRNNFGTFHMGGNRLVKFSPAGRRPFYGIWQPALRGPAPLVVHLPGYGAELSVHPDVNAEGYNVLGLSPLGYWTPDGFDESLRDKNGAWPVLPDTMLSDGAAGYRDWLSDAAAAVMWAWSQPQVISGRVSFYGTSQGGGTALLLGSVFSGSGTRCVAADQPFLTNYPLAANRGAYFLLAPAFEPGSEIPREKLWHGLGFCDTINHADRMNFPVLLTLGTTDDVCPPDTIESLYGKLPATKALYSIDGRCHGYNYEFIRLACAWFRLYA
jgi:cephalosporin-C deacetylase-like acetyl esterase